LISKKELLNKEEENPKWQEHTLLSLAAMDLQNGKGSSREAGVIFIGLARVANRWKRFPEKVVPSDEPMVSPCAGVRSSTHSQTPI
jgi:hypothetical protein